MTRKRHRRRKSSQREMIRVSALNVWQKETEKDQDYKKIWQKIKVKKLKKRLQFFLKRKKKQ